MNLLAYCYLERVIRKLSLLPLPLPSSNNEKPALDRTLTGHSRCPRSEFEAAPAQCRKFHTCLYVRPSVSAVNRAEEECFVIPSVNKGDL
ncbi:unnamed protein product [Nezara viridula]|uniref:Uncharacterized protein n=1 Tax=Nezara viridula TaxID=85310 RepID=A0A9P0H826_NEZVI|nr:unnamed protein product [Nezara viridula]